MKQHYTKCTAAINLTTDVSNNPNTLIPDFVNLEEREHATSPIRLDPPAKRHKPVVSRMDNFVMQTSGNEKAAIDLQIARFVCATNSPFSIVEHPEFLKLITMLRPGYHAPSRHKISDGLLDDSYVSMQSDCKERLADQTVSMMLDGWSNIHNEPIICVSVTTPEGESYLTETVDTSGHAHTAEYLEEVAMSAVTSTEQRFGCKVGTFVTDNASNMVKMRRQLEADSITPDGNIISYGCSAHYFNLLAKDVEIPGVTEHIIQIVKYFRNTHLPAAWYKVAGGKKLVLPLDVRWNTLADCLQSYLDNWATILKVCEEHRDSIDVIVARKVQDLSIKRNAENYLKRMKPIAIALDKVQSDSCKLSESVEVWKRLSEDMASSQPLVVSQKVEKRYNQALTAAHYLANILDPRFMGRNLSVNQIDTALEFCSMDYETCLPTVLNFRAQNGPFKSYMFRDELVKSVSPLTWWESQKSHLESDVIKLCRQILGAITSTAGIERIFSTFGFVHSKVRNRLGTGKAGKLVFIYKLLNTHK